jgi:pimeloyl-ACP methyl ester carboxylesterase
MDALGVHRADVVAHDIGGGIAQLLAVNHPERVDRLVLADAVCFDSWPIPAFKPLQKPHAEQEMSVGKFEQMLREFLPKGVLEAASFTDSKGANAQATEALDTLPVGIAQGTTKVSIKYLADGAEAAGASRFSAAA